MFSIALVAGTSLPIALRMTGYLRGVPLAALMRYLPIFWIGLVVSLVSGGLLLVAYPTKILTNPIFSLKVAAILASIAIVWRARQASRSPVDGAAGTMAARTRWEGYALIGLWAFVIAAGRLLAYTYSRLMVGF